ncbi:hypothetical protein EVAR_61482_1 [Eumeta japonica]|uniref:Uncharacterized protein n=1 Tax=Eumeta variegata TaxID=151549 RepID=A0A4C1ZJ48_EUMVA|nr:hypothetical protein EVAR_61482_1 [Eumeta japonica]
MTVFVYIHKEILATQMDQSIEIETPLSDLLGLIYSTSLALQIIVIDYPHYIILPYGPRIRYVARNSAALNCLRMMRCAGTTFTPSVTNFTPSDFRAFYTTVLSS